MNVHTITLQDVRWQTHAVVSLLLSLDRSMNFSTNSIFLQITHKPSNIVPFIYHLYMQTLIDVSIYAELIIIKKQHGEIVSYISLSNHEHGKNLVCLFVFLFHMGFPCYSVWGKISNNNPNIWFIIICFVCFSFILSKFMLIVVCLWIRF